MNGLVAFLRARLAEDEQIALAAVRWSEGAAEWGAAGEPDWVHIARWDPVRVLAEVEAKRWIVNRFIPEIGTFDPGDADGYRATRDLLHHLVLPYAEHPDCHPSWLPRTTAP